MFIIAKSNKYTHTILAICLQMDKLVVLTKQWKQKMIHAEVWSLAFELKPHSFRARFRSGKSG